MKQVHWILVLGLFLVSGAMCQLKSWAPSIEEVIKKESEQSKQCTSESCRDWNTIRNIAMCKAGQLQKAIDDELEGHSLYYTETSFKNLEEQGWSKFLFSAIESSNTERTHLIKVCVPTDKTKNAWITGQCVWQHCGEIDIDGKCGSDSRFKQLAGKARLKTKHQAIASIIQKGRYKRLQGVIKTKIKQGILDKNQVKVQNVLANC